MSLVPLINPRWLDEFKSKTIWMIHEIDLDDLALIQTLEPKSNVLVFDDAVRSQQLMSRLPMEYIKILAVSPMIATRATEQEIEAENDWNPIEWEKTGESHKKWFQNNDASSFMTWPMIRNLKDEYGVNIALHGLRHEHDANFSRIFFDNLEKAIKMYVHEMKVYPEIYVYPYNEETVFSKAAIRVKGLVSIGKERRNFYDYRNEHIKSSKNNE